MSTKYDVIIIGSGAGGGTLARHLAPSGKSILILERGDWLKREQQNWDVEEVFIKNRYVPKETWYDKTGSPSSPVSITSSAAPPRCMARRSTACARKTSASSSTTMAFRRPGPSATKTWSPTTPRPSRCTKCTARAAKTPPSRRPARLILSRRCPTSRAFQQLHDDLARAGYRPFHAPCGVMLDERNAPFSACIRCKDCDGFPCLVHAKSDAEVLAVRPALKYPNVTLLTNAKVVKLNTNPTGKAVTEVVVERGGEKETYEGGIVVVSAGAANSAKLLLLSANDKHPNGLANGSDQVGRHYMYHNSAAVLAVSKEPNPTVFQKTLGLNDFYFGMKDFEYPMGNISDGRQVAGADVSGEKPIEAGLAPMFVLDEVAKHAVDFWLSTEDLPMPDNRVTLEQDGSIKLSYTPNNQVAKQKLYDKLKSMLNHLGMHPNHLIPRNLYMKNEIGVGGVAHQAGTCRFGKDPKTSVLDVNCKAHELDNLYVVDTSFFPSIGAVNPALTAMANALRVGDHCSNGIK